MKMGNVEFDDTYLDIIAAAKIDISRGVDSAVRKKYLEILQKISNGKVTLQDDRFYLKPGTQAKLEFNLVAEGLRKIALLWQLIKNGTLEKGSVLFWDEPEANINPNVYSGACGITDHAGTGRRADFCGHTWIIFWRSI